MISRTDSVRRVTNCVFWWPKLVLGVTKHLRHDRVGFDFDQRIIIDQLSDLEN
jgi:hypothetical protein